MKKLQLLLALFVCFLTTVQAQWQETEGIYGDYTTVGADSTILIAANGLTPSLRKLFLSNDNGSNWRNINSTALPVGTAASCLLVNNATLFLGTNRGLFISTNNGQDWTQKLPINVTALAMKGTTTFAGTDSSLLISTNGGNSWTLGFKAEITSIAIRDTNMYLGTHDKGILLSTNNGLTWMPINTGLLNNLLPVFAIKIRENKILVGTPIGVYASTNNGNSWTISGSLLVNKTIFSLALSGTNTFAYSDQGTFISTDMGNSWALLSNITQYNVTSLAVIGTKVFAGTWDGAYVSTDNGNNWTSIRKGLSAVRTYNLLSNGATTFLKAAGFNNAYSSTNNGANWTAVNNGLTNVRINAFAVNGTNVFAATSNGVYLSVNNRGNWTAMRNGLTTWVSSLAISGNNIYAGTPNGVYLSTNNGDTWTAINSGLSSNITALAVSGGNVFAGTVNGVYRSNNNGNNWVAVNNGLTIKPVISLVIKGTNMYAVTNAFESDFFLSTDNGNNWTSILPFTARYNIAHLMTNGSNFFLSTDGNGLVLMTNNGVNTTWRPINDNLPTLTAFSSAISGNYLLVSTNLGVFRRPLSDLGLVDTKENQEQINVHIFPNPISNQLTINCSDVLIGKNYTIKNVLGETLQSGVLKDKTTILDSHQLANGLYFLQFDGIAKTLKFVKE